MLRVLRVLRVLAFLLLLVPTCALADGIDDQLAKLAAARKQKADAEKAIAEIEAGLRTALAEIHRKLAEAGVITPGPPPPAPDPKPVDALKRKLREAFEKDGSPTAAARQLAALYRLAVDLARDPAVGTTQSLRARVNEAAESLMKEFPPDASGVRPLKTLRGVVAEAWTEAVGKTDDSPITPDERKAAANLFGRLAEILDGF